MIEITVNNQQITVEESIDLRRSLNKKGFSIPGLCSHPRLKTTGSCRLCTVEANGELTASCEILPEKGMSVVTGGQQVIETRQKMLEILLEKHPPDCLTCDQAGNCKIQEYVFEFGEIENSFSASKNISTNLKTGVLIDQNPARCIGCHRCVKMYREEGGGRDFNMHNRGEYLLPGRNDSLPLENELAGNMVDLCPAGALVDSTCAFRIQGGLELNQTNSIGGFSPFQPPVKIMHRDNEIVKIEANDKTGFPIPWIDDRTRFTHEYNRRRFRPPIPKISPRESLKKINKIFHEGNSEKMAGLISPDRTLEELYLFRRLFNEKINSNLCGTFPRTGSIKINPIRLDRIKESDFILVAGTNFRNEYPLLTPLLREARRQGASVAYLTYWGKKLTFKPDLFIREKPDLLLTRLQRLAGAESEDSSDSQLLEMFERAESPLFISCEGRTMGPELTASLFRWGRKKANFLRLAPGGNSKGAELIFDDPTPPVDILKKAAGGELETLFTYGFDLFRSFPDKKLVKKAIRKTKNFIMADYLDSPTIEKSNIFLPLTTQYEEAGLLVNAEGKLQLRPDVLSPPDGCRSGWQMLAHLAYSSSRRHKIDRKTVAEDCFQATRGLEGITPPEKPGISKQIKDKKSEMNDMNGDKKLSLTRGKWAIFSEPYLFSGDRRAQVCPSLKKLLRHSVVECNNRDARRLGADSSTKLSLQVENTTLTRPVDITDNPPPGSLMIPWNIREDIPEEIFEGMSTSRRVREVKPAGEES